MAPWWELLYNLLCILFHYDSSQNTEYSCLCSMVAPYCPTPLCVFLLSSQHLWSLSTRPRRTSGPFILLYKWLSVWRMLMTGEMKGEEYRSSVAFVLPELRMFLKGCAMVSPPCGPPACLCVVSIAAGSGQYGHQQLLEAVSTASG